MFKTKLTLLLLCFTLTLAQEDLNTRIKDSLTKGIQYLKSQQKEKVYWGHIAYTALVAKVYQEVLPLGLVTPEEVQTLTDFVASYAKEDGGIYDEPQNTNYVTSVCLMALGKDEKYATIRQKAQEYLIGIQRSEKNGTLPNDKFYGGFGYGGENRNWCDLSNTNLALEALAESGVPGNHEVFQRALKFLERCQNQSEYNDQEWASDLPEERGGFVYYPGNSKAGSTTLPNGKMLHHSYGSMTYVGIKSMIYANVDRNDPRITAAMEWIQNHYSVDTNPGMGLQGLYYYYHTFAKALRVHGTESIKTAAGEQAWRKDLSEKLMQLQKEDGHWINTEPRWFESDPVLVSCYSLLALRLCYKD